MVALHHKVYAPKSLVFLKNRLKAEQLAERHLIRMVADGQQQSREEKFDLAGMSNPFGNIPSFDAAIPAADSAGADVV